MNSRACAFTLSRECLTPTSSSSPATFIGATSPPILPTTACSGPIAILFLW